MGNRGRSRPPQRKQQAARRRDEPPVQQQPPVLELSAWQGQLPHPDDLRAYDELVPGAARLLIERVVKQSEHREAREREVIEADLEARRRGQWMGFVLALVCLAICVLAILNGEGVAGVTGAFATIALLVGLFVYANERKVGEMRKKFEIVFRGED